MTQPPTVSTLLFGAAGPHAADLAPAIRTAVLRADSPHPLDTVLDHLVDEELAVALDRACGTRIADILLRAWRTFASLEDAARASVENPGSELPVSLGSHTVHCEQHPQLDVLVAGVSAMTIPLAVDGRLGVTNVVAVVSDGALIALRGGLVDAALHLTAAEVPLASATTTLDLDVAVPLPRPIDLGYRNGPGKGDGMPHPTVKGLLQRTRHVPRPRPGRSGDH